MFEFKTREGAQDWCTFMVHADCCVLVRGLRFNWVASCETLVLWKEARGA